MNLDTIEALVRGHFEPLQYAAFFAVFVFLGCIELVAPLGRDSIDRRRRWPANGGLTVLNILVLGAMPVGIVAAADHAAVQGWGLLNLAVVPPALALGAGFLLRTLLGYFIHVAMHRVPLLWRIHRVHHTDVQMDVSTTVRFHPLELVVSMPVLLGMAVLRGIPPLALILYELLDTAMAVFTHANIRLPDPVDRALRLVLVTPAMHRLHHSAHQPETDGNYGAMLTWWDRLFGTYRVRPPAEIGAIRLGLDEWPDRRVASLWWLLRLPFAAAGRARPVPPPGQTHGAAGGAA